MVNPDTATFERVLSQPDVPWARLARGSGDLAVVVDDLVAYARGRTELEHDLERRLDRYVEHVGGERLRMVDPWSWLSRVVLRRQGSRQDVYVLPASWAARLGVVPARDPRLGEL
ncbi:MAG TPA: hypothetical protein VFT50_14830 [Baekduia sp.]|nr:hypothetical protein [Baekduia sp.]